MAVPGLRRAIMRMLSDPALSEPLEGAPRSVWGGNRVPRQINALPDAELRALAHIYATGALDRPYSPPTRFAKINPEHAREYAREYDAMADTPDERLTARAWEKMGDETLDQLDMLHDAGYRFSFNPNKENPYAANPRLALEDLRENKHLWIFPTEEGYGTLNEAKGENPLLKPVRGMSNVFGGAPFVQNDAFRVVHDALGHAPVGAGFRAAGEENAFRHHASLYSDLARVALAAETRGQNSFVNYSDKFLPNRGMTVAEWNKKADGKGTVYADQKSGTMPDYVYNRGIQDFAGPISLSELRKRIAAMLVMLGGAGAARELERA